MARIIAGMFVSLDGVAGSPDRWVFPYFTPEVGQIVAGNIEGKGSILMGRTLYEEWSSYWPGKTAADDEFAPFINNTPKYVVSNTLRSADWSHSSIISGDVRAQIEKLKAESEQDIGMSGSMTLVGWLLRQGLLDELSLVVFPVLVGSGKRVFDGEGEHVPLELSDAQTLDNGVQSLRYVPAKR